jgi:hypothetical protein
VLVRAEQQRAHAQRGIEHAQSGIEQLRLSCQRREVATTELLDECGQRDRPNRTELAARGLDGARVEIGRAECLLLRQRPLADGRDRRLYVRLACNGRGRRTLGLTCMLKHAARIDE